MADTLAAAATVSAVAVFGFIVLQDNGSRGLELELQPGAAAVQRVEVPQGAKAGRRASGPAEPDEAWVRDAAQRTAISVAATRAYARGSLAAPEDCSLGWTTLAAIGWVESHHGTLGGRTLGEDGHSSSRILGPALDGTGNFAAIRATPEGTAMHGNAQWDHAVGPMQFIPSTWETWGSDGDRDGTADPNDLDDAAVAAARYLCHAGGDLSTVSGWTAAVKAYNHSMEYVHQVNAVANAYAAR